LRRFPIISFGSRNERLRAPLPHLITLRTTSGIYYDLISGPARLRNEAAKRFESYSAKYIQSMLPSSCVKRSYKYRLRGNVVDTPDIFVTNQGEVVVVIECKATKLTFGAQFAEDPMSEAKSAYDEIVKGVFQIWRYFSHVRRGLVDTAAVNPDACGMILTLDTWLDMSRELQEGVIANAATLASDSDPEIIAQDRRSIISVRSKSWSRRC